MGTSQSIKKINFEDLQWALKNSPNILISTMKEHYQNCLIVGTTPIYEEEDLINSYLKRDTSVRIIIYGINSCDNTIIEKYFNGFFNLLVRC